MIYNVFTRLINPKITQRCASLIQFKYFHNFILFQHNYTVSGQVTSSQVNVCNNPNLIVRQSPDSYSTPAGSNVSTLKQLTESHCITTEEYEVNYPMVSYQRVLAVS
jgi:hypothetical protein